MTKAQKMRRLMAVTFAVGALVAWRISLKASATNAVWNAGDVFAGIGSGSYNVYDGTTGAYKDTITDTFGANGRSHTTGCAFTPTFDKLYTTYFDTNIVVVYDDAVPHNILQRINTTPDPGSGDSTAENESVVFDTDGNFYVGHAGFVAGPGGPVPLTPGGWRIQKYNPAGTWLASYLPTREFKGSDWVELAADNSTIFYTSEGTHVLRFNAGTNSQGANFGGALGGTSAFALRLLPPGDGSGGLIVADTQDIKRLDGSGNVVQTYDVPGQDAWFALNRDPNTTSFWSADLVSGNIYKMNINTGAVELMIPTGVAPGELAGLCIKGELTPPTSLPGRMTGGGSEHAGINQVSHGFELHCDPEDGPNNLEVNWTGGNKFHLEKLTAAACSDDPNIVANPPNVGFDTYAGFGVGRLNGVPGATATWVFQDAGEPGTKDTISLVIKNASNQTVLVVPESNLDKGNHQAHNETGNRLR
jgi:hypothetical protein